MIIGEDNVKKLSIIMGIILVMVVSLFIWNYYKADYVGIVGKVTDTDFYLGPTHIDPEASYGRTKINYDKDTLVTDEKKEPVTLKDGQKVKIWIAEEKYAEKIIVLSN